MVKLAIRDDDANFFTKVEDIEFVYKDFEGFPISFAVVPHVRMFQLRGHVLTQKETLHRVI